MPNQIQRMRPSQVGSYQGMPSQPEEKLLNVDTTVEERPFRAE